MELQSPVPERHLGDLAHLFAATFGNYWNSRDYWDSRDRTASGYFSQSPYDWHASRIGVENGEVATHFGVFDFRMRVGVSAVRLAGIGGVATARDFRRRGLMDETARACVDNLGSAGYDMSLLFGIQDFYHRYGYASSFAECSFILGARELPAGDPAVAFQAHEGDVSGFADQYNSENSGVTGTFVRPTFVANPRHPGWKFHVFDGGYVVSGMRDGKLEVADCCGPPERVLGVVRQLAAAEFSPEVCFVFLPRRSVMGAHLLAGSHTYTMKQTREGGAMVRVVNLLSTMRKIAPELERRLAGSALARHTGSLAIHGDGEEVLVRFRGGAVAVEPAAGGTPRADGAITAGPAIARLVIGDDEPWRVCAQSGVTLAGDAVHLAPVLFPAQEPQTVLWDRF